MNINPETVREKEYRHTEWDRLWREAGEAWRPDARAVLDILETGKYVAVDAPHGTGKSLLLVGRNLASEAKVRGYDISEQDNAWHVYSPGSLGRNPEEIESRGLKILAKQGSSKKLLVIDECGDLEDYPSLPKDDSSFMTKNQADLVLVPAGRTQKVREEIIGEWARSLAVFGRELVTHHMQQRTLPIEKVEDYLKKIGADDEFIRFYSNPENISLLTPSGFWLSQQEPARSITELLDRFLTARIWDSMKDGAGLSKNHLRKLLENLGVYTMLSENDRRIFDGAIDFD